MRRQRAGVLGGSSAAGWWPILIGLAGALSVSSIWVVLTVQTGLTFHFYPGIIVVAPVFLARQISGRPISRPVLAGFLAAGAGAVVAGWLVLTERGARPTATFVEGQWGGVELEVVVFSILGAGLAARIARRPR